jgi:hypothetical protein
MAASPVADDCFSSAHVEKRCAPAGVEYRLVGSQEECDWHNDVLLSLLRRNELARLVITVTKNC